MVSKNHHYLVALSIICCIGFAFRIYNINVSLWCDEMMQATAASAEWKDLFYLIANHSSPPLDYALMKTVILCFGKATGFSECLLSCSGLLLYRFFIIFPEH